MKLRTRLLKLLEVVRTALQKKGVQGIGLLITQILPVTRKTVQSIQSADAKIRGNPSSIDALLLQDLKHIVENLPSMGCPVKDNDDRSFDGQVKGGIIFMSTRWILRSIYRLDLRFNGRSPNFIIVLHRALHSTYGISAYLKQQNK